MSARAVALAVAVLAGTLTTGCISPRALEQLPVLKASDLIGSPGGGRDAGAQQIREAITKAKVAGGSMAGTLAILLALVCAYKAKHGDSRFLEIARVYLSGILGCAFVLAFWGTSLGVDTCVREVGAWLGREMAPTQSMWGKYLGLGQKITKEVRILFDAVGAGTAAQTVTSVTGVDPGQAIGYWLAEKIGAPTMMLNGIIAYLAALILQNVQAWLIAFYTCVGPIVAPALILPSTRGIFYGWLRAYAALCLWGPLMGIMERIALSIPEAAWNVGLGAGSQGLAAAGEAVLTASLGLALINILLIISYLSIPVAASLLVNAAGRSFRGVL